MAAGAQVTWRGYRGPGGRFTARAETVLEHTLVALEESLLGIAREVTPISPPGSGPPGTLPGQLRRDLRVIQVRQGAHGSITLESPTAYGRFVREGRGPIVARPGHVLAFWIGGKLLFRKRVGPAAGQPYIDQTWARWGPVAQAQLQTLVGQLSALLVED